MIICPSARPCIRVSPFLSSYPRVTVCLFLYPYMTCLSDLVSACHHLYLHPHMIVCLSDLVSACYRLLAFVSPYDFLSLLLSACYRLFTLVSSFDCLSVLVSACYCLFTLVSACDCLSVLVRPVTVCLPLFPHVIVSLSVLLSAFYHGEFDISEPNEKRHLETLCTHGSQLTMQIDYAIYSCV